VNRGLAIALAVVSIAVAACGGSSLAPAPQPTAGAAVTPAPLPAGQHTSAAFQPAVTFTTTEGWVLYTDTPSYLNLGPVVGGDVVGIHLFRDPLPLAQASDCPLSAEPGVSATSSVTFLAWMKTLKGFTLTTPTMATIGGLPASAVDVSIKANWTSSCPFAGGLPTVPLFYGATSGLRWVVAGDQRLRLYFVDLPNGGFFVVDIDAFVGTEMDGLLSAAAPVIKSMTFASN
jgi:hypothetical protein